MLIRLLVFGLLVLGPCSGSFRVKQVMQAPSQRAQDVYSLAADRNGYFIVAGSNVNGGFVSKLDPNGNVVFNFANSGLFPAGAVVDDNGDVYWFGSEGAPGFHSRSPRRYWIFLSQGRVYRVSLLSFMAQTARSFGL